MRYRHDGKPRKLTLDRYPRLSLAEARQAATAALAAVDAGRDPANEKRTTKQAVVDGAGDDSVPAIVDLFIARHVRLNGHRSAEETARVLRREVSRTWSDLKIQDVTRRKVIELLDSIVDRGSPGTANAVFRLLGGLMNWCMDRDILEISPCERLKAPAAQGSRDRILTDDEVRWFWRTAEAARFPFGPLFQLLLLTGASDAMRSQGCAGLR